MPAALLHRQRLLLAFFHLLGKECGRLFLMKSMFLLCKEELHANVYDFHPYRHGPFSLTLFADLRSLERAGYVRQGEHDVRLVREPEKSLLASIDRHTMNGLLNIVRKYKDIPDFVLLKKVYKEYPYFATRNPRYKSHYAFADPRNDPAKKKAALFTIGYEGKNIDRFLDELIAQNIQVLADIRHNPVSMKYDFSGKKLREYCRVRGIEYLGIPELGIPSASRQNLNTPEDYRRLFSQYRRAVLPRAEDHLRRLSGILAKGKRLALMCFEKDRMFCHRNDAASALSAYCNQRYELAHV